MQTMKQPQMQDTILVVELDSPIGRLPMAIHRDALCALALDADDATFTRSLAGMPGAVRHCAVDELDGEAARIADAITRYFDGDIHAIDDIPVRATGSGFQHRVWDALRTIPAGETTSYAQIAAEVGAPAASRAVGRANGTNPVPIVVPCHRVIRADGTLGGYGGGLDRKRWLLAHERAHTSARAGALAL
jgi:methylated-DNA-[protein]-cysteine S-methyltransferase